MAIACIPTLTLPRCSFFLTEKLEQSESVDLPGRQIISAGLAADARFGGLEREPSALRAAHFLLIPAVPQTPHEARSQILNLRKPSLTSISLSLLRLREFRTVTLRLRQSFLQGSPASMDFKEDICCAASTRIPLRIPASTKFVQNGMEIKAPGI
jgi:hypothetical protein